MRVLIEREDGGVSIMTLIEPPGLRELVTLVAEISGEDVRSGDARRELDREVDDLIQTEVEKWETASESKAVSNRVIADDALPADRTFRNAWQYRDGRIETDMAKAREIHRDHMRRVRKPLLEALDTEALRAIESGDTAELARVAARKQALRDVTKSPAINAASTPTELKRMWPAILKPGVK